MNTQSKAPEKEDVTPKADAHPTAHPAVKNDEKDTRVKGRAKDVSNDPNMDPNLPARDRALEARRRQSDQYLNPEQKKMAKIQEEEALAEMNMSKADFEKVVEEHLRKAMEGDRNELQGPGGWDRNDTGIPQALKDSGSVSDADYKCPEGHKTKATNLQEKDGVDCSTCRDQGKKVKATIMDQFKSEDSKNSKEAPKASAKVA